MANINLPKELRKDIREYFKTIMQTMQQQGELDLFIKTISPSLALRVRGHMFQNLLKTKNKIIIETQAKIIAIANPGGVKADKKPEAAKRARRNTINVTMAELPLLLINDGKKRADLLLDKIVRNLGTSLNLPDEEVIRQDDQDNEEEAAMFFVGTGHCKVRVKDHNGREHHRPTLKEGAHFGEIALLYKCKRSATVISSNYNTFAEIKKPRFREVISEFPEYEVLLKENAIKNYRDPKIEFILKMIKRVEYLKGHKDDVLFDLMFSLEPKSYEKDSMILDEE